MTSENDPGPVATTHFEAIAEYLDGAGVRYELVEHEPTTSAGAEAQALHESPERVARTIVLHDGKAYAIAAVCAADRLDMRKLRDLLGATRHLRLASEEEIARDFPTLDVGAIPPFGPMLPAVEVIDSALLRQQRIVCPAGDHRHSVLLDPHDLVKMTAATVADISEQ